MSGTSQQANPFRGLVKVGRPRIGSYKVYPGPETAIRKTVTDPSRFGRFGSRCDRAVRVCLVGPVDCDSAFSSLVCDVVC